MPHPYPHFDQKIHVFCYCWPFLAPQRLEINQTTPISSLIPSSRVKLVEYQKTGPCLKIWFIFKKISFSVHDFAPVFCIFEGILRPKCQTECSYGFPRLVYHLGWGNYQKLNFHLHILRDLRFFYGSWLILVISTIFVNFEPGEVWLGKSDMPKRLNFLDYTSQGSIWPTNRLLDQLFWNLGHPTIVYTNSFFSLLNKDFLWIVWVLLKETQPRASAAWMTS